MLKLECAEKTVTIESDQVVGIEDSTVQTLVQSALKMHDSIPLVSIRMRLTDPGSYRYTFEAVDGRKWRQDLRFQNGEVYQTFSINDEWAEREFALHRPVRGGCISLVKQFGATDVRIDWK